MKPKFDYGVFAGAICLFIGVSVLVGWFFDIEILKSVLRGSITMKVNTAILFILSSMMLVLSRQHTRFNRGWLTAFATATLSLSSATLLQYLLDANFGIDEFFINDTMERSGHFPPGRLAPVTAICFILLTISFLTMWRRSRWVLVLSQLLAVTVFFVAFQGVIGYVIGVTYLFGSAYYTQMAVHTAVCFVFLSTGRLYLESRRGFVHGLRTGSPTARMTRWMLTTAVIVPPIVMWAGHHGYTVGLYDADFRQLIQAVGTMVAMALIIFSAGSALFRTEAEMLSQQLAQQKTLRESEEKFRALVDASAQIVWSATGTGEIVEDSPSWRSFTGQNFDEMKGRGWLEAVHPHDQGRAAHTWDAAVRARISYQVEFRIRHRGGEWRWMLARGTPILHRDGSVRSWVGMISDIHERKLIEFDLKNAKREAEQANDLKSAFLANMSHEIRTPLGAMIGFTELLRGDRLTDAERTSYIDTVLRNGAQLSVIISDILDLSRIESGLLKLEYCPANPVEVLKDAMGLLEGSAKLKNIEFSYEADADLPTYITTDSVRLKQILKNVIGNAIKFTNAGHVRIQVMKDGPKAIAFEIEDTGIGILESQKRHIFENFVQADGSLTRRFGGNGLGLSLSRRLARELGGDVELKTTTPGMGTVFRVRIGDRAEAAASSMASPAVAPPPVVTLPPLQSPPPSVPAPIVTPQASPGALKGMKILVVDDTPDNQELITYHLRKMGAQVASAANGYEGFQRAANDSFDVVLMDLQMPVMDGYTATQKLRAIGFSRPIIALTAHAMTEIRQKCLDVGCTDHLSKPINFGILASKISRYAQAHTRH